MKGIEISEQFYIQYGKQMLEKEFSDVLDRLAIGLVGEGSECFGYDDEISRDHDFDAGFCIFITKEDERKFGFNLERAYARLPKEFMGLKRNIISPVGGDRRGVIAIEDFYTKFLGESGAPSSNKHWLFTPSYSLLSACNGKVFCDNLGKFGAVRQILLKGYPEDVRLKKLSSNIIIMAQSGQYNYERCARRGETGAAQLAIFEFVKHTISTIFLLNNKYEPFYKWAYKGMRNLKVLGDLELSLVGLTELDNSKNKVLEKIEIIEDISKLIVDELKKQQITRATCNNLEKHANSILDFVKDSELRNMHIMEG